MAFIRINDESVPSHVQAVRLKRSDWTQAPRRDVIQLVRKSRPGPVTYKTHGQRRYAANRPHRTPTFTARGLEPQVTPARSQMMAEAEALAAELVSIRAAQASQTGKQPKPA